jgi:hypothetical protein
MPDREFWDEMVTEDEIRIAKYYEKDGKGIVKGSLHLRLVCLILP